MQAVEIGNEEIIKMLLGKGAKPDTIVNDRTPLSIAKEMGNREIVELLESYLPSWYLCMTRTFYMVSPCARLLRLLMWSVTGSEFMKFGESM